MAKKLQLKQENKKHKKEGGHSSKRKKIREEKGRTNGSQTKERSRNKDESRHEKANKKIQQRRNKVEATLLNNRVRLLAPLGTQDHQVVAVISLNALANINTLIDALKRGGGKEIPSSIPTSVTRVTDVLQLEFSDCKNSSSFTFLSGNTAAVDPVMLSLDLVRAADMIVFCVGVANDAISGHSELKKSDPIDATGQRTLTALRALGFPSQIFVFSHFVGGLPINAGKQPHLHQRALQIQLQEVGRVVRTAAGLGENAKLLDSLHPAQQTARSLWETSNSAADAGPVWRSSRSYLLSLKLSVSSEEVGSDHSGKESFVVEGFLKGRPLAVNSLVHILGAGVARIKSISSTTGGFSLVADPTKQESLDFAAVGDALQGEQTWPTEAEMQEADSQDISKRQTPSSVPKGMSSYQADWFTDEQGEFDRKEIDEEEEEEEEEGGDMEGESASVAAPAAEARDRQAEKQRQREEERKRMLNDEMAFPDEVDTPEDVSARARFARYRALQSFKNSTWHPKENLPQEYSRIFHLQNFNLVQKRLQEQGRLVDLSQQQYRLKAKKEKKKETQSTRGRSRSSAGGSIIGDRDDDDRMDAIADGEIHEEDDMGEGDDVIDAEEMVAENFEDLKQHTDTFAVPAHPDYVQSGQYVILELECVSSASVVSRMAEYGHVSVFGLLPHENQMSVLHFNCQRVLRSQGHAAVNDSVVKSKDTILVQTGFRSFLTRPIFSEANLNCDKHKFSRFLQHGTFSVGSCFGPMTLTPCPVLLFTRPDGADESGVSSGWQLIATGTMAYADPDRIILKKIVLSGIPIRVRKKYAVVKHMFRETQDVRWFKPAELCTKHGLRGNITEPVGLHGLFKARFSAPITQNDTVLLVLYKRVYPKMPISSSEVIADKICDVIVK